MAPVLAAALFAVLLLGARPALAWHWPWRRPAAPVPQAVQAVKLTPDAGVAGVPQYWDRNALLLDLSAVSGEGGATLAPIAGWPVRMEFRVRPGSIARLTVQAAERVIYEVPSDGAPLLLKLAAGVYQRDTGTITLRWSATDDSAR